MEFKNYVKWMFQMGCDNINYYEDMDFPQDYVKSVCSCKIYNEFGIKHLSNYPNDASFEDIFSFLSNHAGKIMEQLNEKNRSIYISHLNDPQNFEEKRHLSLIKCFIKCYICELAPVDRIQYVLSSSISLTDSTIHNNDEIIIPNNFTNIRKSLYTWLSINACKGLEKLHMKLNQSYSKTEWMRYINNYCDLGSLLIYTINYCAQSRIGFLKAHVPTTQRISSGEGLSHKERLENSTELLRVFTELIPEDEDVELPLTANDLCQIWSISESNSSDSIFNCLSIALVFHYTAGVGLKNLATLLNTPPPIIINEEKSINSIINTTTETDNNTNQSRGFFLDLTTNNKQELSKVNKLFKKNTNQLNEDEVKKYNGENDSGNNSPDIFLTPTEEFSVGFNQLPTNSTKLLQSKVNNTDIPQTISILKQPDITEIPSLKERYQQKKKEAINNNNTNLIKKQSPVRIINPNETTWAAQKNKETASPLKKQSPKITKIFEPPKKVDDINEIERQKIILDLSSKRQKILNSRKENDNTRKKVIDNHKKEIFFTVNNNNSLRRNSNDSVNLIKDNNNDYANKHDLVKEVIDENIDTKLNENKNLETINEIKPVSMNGNHVDISNNTDQSDHSKENINKNENLLNDVIVEDLENNELEIEDIKQSNDIIKIENENNVKVDLITSITNVSHDNIDDLDNEDEDDVLDENEELFPESVSGHLDLVESIELKETKEDDPNDPVQLQIIDINNNEPELTVKIDSNLSSSSMSSLSNDDEEDEDENAISNQLPLSASYRPEILNLHNQLINLDHKLSTSLIVKPSDPIILTENTPINHNNTTTPRPQMFVSFSIDGNKNDDEDEDDEPLNKSITSFSSLTNEDNNSNNPVAFIIDETLQLDGKGDKEVDEARRLKEERMAKLEENRLKRLEKVKMDLEKRKEKQQQQNYELERQKEEKRKLEEEKRKSVFAKYKESKEEKEKPTLSTQHFQNASQSSVSTTTPKVRLRANTITSRNNSNTNSPNKRSSQLYTSSSSIKKNDRLTSASTPRLNNIIHDPSTFGKPLPAQEYSGIRLYKQPQGKSNRTVIINAISYCCLAGSVNEPVKESVLKKLSETEGSHFMVLFRDTRCQYRALYNFDLSSEQLHIIVGTGPRLITHEMVEKFYKYNSGAKQFKLITSTKHLSPAIDGVCIQAHLWSQLKSTATGSGSGLSSALSSSRIFTKN